MLKPLDTSANAAWKQRFRAARIVQIAIANQNPTRGFVSTNRDGMFQIYSWDIPGGTLTQLTNEPEGKYWGALSADARYVYFFQDEKGNEVGHFVRVPLSGGDMEDLTPDLPPYNSFFVAASEGSPVLGLIAIYERKHHVYVLSYDDQGMLTKPKLLFASDFLAGPLVLSHDGSLAAVGSLERSKTINSSVIAFDVSAGSKLDELFDADRDVSPIGFAPSGGDSRLLARTNRSGFFRPIIWDVRTGQRTDIDLQDLDGDVNPVGWWPDGKSILLEQTAQARQQFHRCELETGVATRLESQPSGNLGGIAGVEFGTRIDPASGEIITVYDHSGQPPGIVSLDPASGAIRRTLVDSSDSPAGIQWRSVSFPSSDGQMIQAWVATPEGEGPFPCILHTHGGPEMVMTDVFSPPAQAWLDHGLAFISVNYRGSTTFGREFREKIWGNLGHWEIEDICAARDWLVAEKIADPESILLTGASYGGYNTLQALGKKPDLWAGGMAQVPIADWTAVYEDESEGMKSWLIALFQGKPEDKPDVFAASSPITYAGQVRAPVLIIQGRNDPRCPARQVEMYEARLKELDKPVQVEWYDAGHGALDVQTNIDHTELMLRFVYRALG